MKYACWKISADSECYEKALELAAEFSELSDLDDSVHTSPGTRMGPATMGDIRIDFSYHAALKRTP